MDIFNKRIKKNVWLNFILFRKYTILISGILSLCSWTTLMQKCYAQYYSSLSATDQFYAGRFSNFENRQIGIANPQNYDAFLDINGFKNRTGSSGLLAAVNPLQNLLNVCSGKQDQYTLQPMNDGWNQFNGQQPYPYSVNNRLYGQSNNNYLNSSPGMSSQNTIQPSIYGQNPFFQFVASAFLKMCANFFAPKTTTSNFNSLKAETQLKVGMQSMGISNSTGDNETFESRFQEVKKQQLDFYYNDNDLHNLRVEANQKTLYYLYTDPLYLYWSYRYKLVYTCKNKLNIVDSFYFYMKEVCHAKKSTNTLLFGARSADSCRMG